MKKTLITVFAFLVIFGFTITGAIAQTWVWTQPMTITNGPFEDFEAYPSFTALNGSDGLDPATWTPVTYGDPVTGVEGTDTNISEADVVDFVVTPPIGAKYGIDINTVAAWDGYGYVALDPQPTVPEEKTGGFTHIAARSDGTIYVVFEEAGTRAQYLLEGTPPFTWEEVTVRFSPRSLNLGSKGKWVTCMISDFPDGYTSAEVNLDNLCITAINDQFLEAPICRATNGPANNRNKKKLMVKFDRQVLSAAIAANPIVDEPNTAKITVAGYSQDGELQFYGEDTIETKPAKPPKPPKPPKGRP